jgi:serine/threonine protein kinase
MVKITKKLTRKQKGGYKLGQGSFGCVISPNIPCSPNKKYSKPKVSKLIAVRDKHSLLEIKEEIRINKFLNKIDPTNKYFITIEDYCKIHQINQEHLETRDNIALHHYDSNIEKYNKCSINKNRVNYNLIMPFAGNDLYNVIEEDTSEFKLSIMTSKIKFIIKHLLSAIKLLHKHQIIHQDIKLENITFNLNIPEKRIECGIIDFGLAYDIRKSGATDDIFSYYAGTPGYIPPEAYIVELIYRYGLNKLNNPNLKQQILRKLNHELNTTVVFYNTIGMYNSIFKKKKITRDTLLEFISPSPYSTFKSYFSLVDLSEIYDIYSDLIKHDKLVIEYFKLDGMGLFYKYDIYAMGIVFYQIFKTLNLQDPSLLDLIKNMIMVNPFKRYNVNQCLAHPYLKNLSISKARRRTI